MTYTPAVKQLTKMEQAHEEPCYWTPAWVDGLAPAATTATAYSLTTLRTNAGLAAGQPVFIKLKVSNDTNINFNNTAAAITTETDGAGATFMNANDVPRLFYCDANITSISFYCPNASTKIAIEVYKT